MHHLAGLLQRHKNTRVALLVPKEHCLNKGVLKGSEGQREGDITEAVWEGRRQMKKFKF